MRLYYVSSRFNVVPYELNLSHPEKTHSSINGNGFISSFWNCLRCNPAHFMRQLARYLFVRLFMTDLWRRLRQNRSYCFTFAIENAKGLSFHSEKAPLDYLDCVIMFVCHRVYSPVLDDAADYVYLKPYKQELINEMNNKIMALAIGSAAQCVDCEERRQQTVSVLISTLIAKRVRADVLAGADVINYYDTNLLAACVYAKLLVEIHKDELEDAMQERCLNLRRKLKSFFLHYMWKRSRAHMVGTYVDYKISAIKQVLQEHENNIIENYNSFMTHHKAEIWGVSKVKPQLKSGDIVTLEVSERIPLINALFSPVRRHFKNRHMPKMNRKHGFLIDSVNQLSRWEEECAVLERMKKSAAYQCYQSHVLK